MTASDHTKSEGWRKKSWLHWLRVLSKDTHAIDGPPTNILERCSTWFDEEAAKKEFAAVIVKESRNALDSFLLDMKLSSLSVLSKQLSHTVVIHYRCGDILTKPNGPGWRLVRYPYYLSHLRTFTIAEVQRVLILGQFDTAMVKNKKLLAAEASAKTAAVGDTIVDRMDRKSYKRVTGGNHHQCTEITEGLAEYLQKHTAIPGLQVLIYMSCV
jgi:hypothetical protein